MIAENETMKTSKELAPSMREAVQQILAYLENEQKRRDIYTQKHRKTLNLSNLNQLQRNQKSETVLPIVGDTSSGKSSVLNKLLRYPILPVAAESTSAYPVEIRYAKAEQERLEVALIDIKNVYKSQKACFTFDANSSIDKQTFRDIYTYAQDLALVVSGTKPEPIIVLRETLEYFKTPDPSLFNCEPREGEIPGTILTRKNPRHVLFLVMLLLAIHAGQDKESERLTEEKKRLLQERKRLMTVLRIPTDKPYLIRLYWHSSSIPKNTVIIDLPGLGADNRTTDATIADDKQVEAYLDSAPSVVFLLGERGVVESEDIRTKINNFIEANSAKSSPARLSFVINKADLITRGISRPEDKENAVNSIRQKYDDIDDRYKDFPMFAISAYAGEKWYLESDIPPENLLTTRANYPAISRRPTPAARIEELKFYLDDDFNAEYACRIDNDTIESMNLETFFRQFFSEQVGKLHMLQAFDTVEWHFNSLQGWIDRIKNELVLLNTAKCFGSAASKKISEVAEDALKMSFNTISEIVDDAMLDMEAELVCADLRITGEMTAQNERIVQIMSKTQKEKVTNTKLDIQRELPLIQVFKNCNNELNKSVMNRFAEAVQRMEKSTGLLNRSSFIPLDYHLTGKAFRNYEKLKEATGKLAKEKLDKYFQKGYNALRREMREEAEVYKRLCDLVVNELEGLPNAMAQTMKKQFDEVYKEVQDTAAKQSNMGAANSQVELATRKDDFQKHYDSAINHLKDVVSSDVNEIVYCLKMAPGADAEIDKTVNLVRQALASILDPYTKPDHAKIIVDKITDSHYFVADRLDAAAFKSFLENDYINDFEEKLQKGIRDAFVSDSNNEVYGHTERMQEVVSDVKAVYVSETQLNALKEFICGSYVSVNTKELMRDLPKRLQTAAQDLCAFVDEQSLYALLQKPWAKQLGTLTWASKTIAGISEKANSVKKTLDKTMETVNMITQDS